MDTLTVGLDAAWERIQSSLREAVGERTYKLWLEPLHCESLDGETLLLSGPAEIATWATDRLGRVLQASAAAVLGPAVTVEVLPAEGKNNRRPAPANRRPAGPPPETVPAIAEVELNPKYTFEQFVIGPSNRLAHAAALSVAEMPAQAYNPLFIYGQPGLGKTHLLHSIGNYVRRFGAGTPVRYATVESFTSGFVSALSNGSIERFKSHFRGAGVLLIDDLQFLERKARTEEELFHTFNSLYDSGSQLVLTSDRLPNDLDGLAERLRQRFSSGLVTDIGRPDLTTRLAILRKRAAHDGLHSIDDSVLLAIAETVDSNVRALEGALIRVVAHASLTGAKLDSVLVGETLGALAILREPRLAPTISAIQLATANHFQISPEELLSRSRTERVAWPRQAAMYLAREMTEHSLPEIGREFGGRDHTTVLHACRRTAARLSTSPEAYTAVTQITDALASRTAGHSRGPHSHSTGRST